MNSWTKFFADGSIEIGTEEDAKASWSQGKLSEMIGCQINYKDAIISLHGKGEYWQSDDFEVKVLESIPICVTKRIQKKIEITDKCVMVHKTNNPKRLQVVFEDTLKSKATDLSDKVGLWLVVELLLDNPGIRILFKEHKI